MPTSPEPVDLESGSGHQNDYGQRVNEAASNPLSRLNRAIFQRKSQPSNSIPMVAPVATVKREWWETSSESVVREVGKCHHGWPRLSAAMDSDSNFMIYRRFGYLRTRLLTYHQDVLREMEVKLDELDEDDDKDDSTNGAMCNREADDKRRPARRKNLFQSLNKEFSLYDELLIRSQQLYRFDSPTKHNQQSVIEMILSDGTLDKKDRDYIRHEDDLITFEADIESSWVHRIVGIFIKLAGEGFTRRLLRSDVQRKKATGLALGIQPFQRVKFNKAVEFLFAVLAIITLIGPIYILNAIRKKDPYIQTTAVFISTALIAFLMSTATAAKRHEVFAGTSAYCAVLVVFTSQNASTQ